MDRAAQVALPQDPNWDCGIAYPPGSLLPAIGLDDPAPMTAEGLRPVVPFVPGPLTAADARTRRAVAAARGVSSKPLNPNPMAKVSGGSPAVAASLAMMPESMPPLR